VHPGLALEGLKRCLYWMAEWSGGQIAPGIVDEYPLPPKVVSAAALLAMVILGYSFLSAGRRGGWAWPIRIGTTLAFGVLCLVMLRAYGS